MMDIPASPPSFSFPRITRRRRNTNSGASPNSPNAPNPPQVPQLSVPHPPSTAPQVTSPTSPSPNILPTPSASGLAQSHHLPEPADRSTYRIRLVPHLENARSLHFEPIIRDVKVGGPPLRVGRFTDRATNPPRGNGLNPNDRNSDKVAFRSKVVSRAHAELWVQGKGVFFLKDTKSSSGTFINHMRLSAPGQESSAHILKDGDIIQLGVDYQGGTQEMYRCVKIKVEVGQGREWQGGANAFNTAALAQLRTLQAIDGPKGKGSAKKSVGDCCICLFAVGVCQSLFIAPCSHAFHYKCIRPLLELHHPGFSCPLCRTFADLDADVEVDENEMKAIEDALDEAEEAARNSDSPKPNGLAAKREPAGTAEDAIIVDSDSAGSPHARRHPPNGQLGSGPHPDAHFSAADDDRQVEDELEVDYEDDEDERMVSGSADEFGARTGDDLMDTTCSPEKRGGPFEEAGASAGAGPSGARSIPLRIDAKRNDADVRAEREAREFADAATPLNNTFMAMGPSLIGAFGVPARTNAVPNGHVDEDLDEDAHGGWTESEAQDAARGREGRGSSSGSNAGTTGNSPGAAGSGSGGGSGGARGAVVPTKTDRRTASESGIRTISRGDLNETA